MVVYVSFALMIWHWLAVVVLAWIWGGFFVVNMMLTGGQPVTLPGVGRVQAPHVVASLLRCCRAIAQ